MFNILDHIDLLTHRLVKESPSEYRYLCPVCDNDTLTVKKHTSSSFTAGAYQCWAGCQCHEIRDAMGVRTYNSNTVSLNKWKASKPKVYPPIVPPQHLELIHVEPRTPSYKWDGDKRVMRYNYSPTQYFQSLKGVNRLNSAPLATNNIISDRYVERIEWMSTTEDGEYRREKSFRQYSNGRLGKGDELWDMYLWDKVVNQVTTLESIHSNSSSCFNSTQVTTPTGNLVIVPEGEKSVQAWWLHGIAATCPQGSCWTSSDLKRYAQSFKDKNLYPLLIPDVDLAGERKRDKWLEACREIGLWSTVLDLRDLGYWQEGWDSYELLMLHTTYTLSYVRDLVKQENSRLSSTHLQRHMT